MPYRKIIFSLVTFTIFIFLYFFIPDSKVFAQVACKDVSDCPEQGRDVCWNGSNYCNGNYVENVRACSYYTCDGYNPAYPDFPGECTARLKDAGTITHSDLCTYGCNIATASCNLPPSTCDGTTYQQLCNSGTGVQTCQGKNGTYDPGCTPNCTTCETRYACSGSSCVANGSGSYTTLADCTNVCGGGPTCNFDSSSNRCCAPGYSQYVNAGTWSDGSGLCFDTGPCNQVDATCGGTPKYKCSGTSCIRDDTNGSYTTSNCDNACTLPTVDMSCLESVSKDRVNWSNSISANPGERVYFKMDITNHKDTLNYVYIRNKFDEMIGGYTNIWQNTDPDNTGIPWLIYNQTFPGIYWDAHYEDYGGFSAGMVDTTIWWNVLNSNAQTFKNRGYAAYDNGLIFPCNSVTVRTFYPVSGWIKDSQTKAGLPNVEIQVYDNDLALPLPQKTKTTRTGPDGHWLVDNFVRGGDSYAVRVTGNSNPQKAPTNYVPPAKTSTIGWTWNWALNPNPPSNPQADTPLGSLSYEGQRAGSGIDCSGPNGSGTTQRCSFEYDPLTNNAQYISQTCPPPTMAPGQTANVSMTMKNIGNTTWTTTDKYRLGSQNYQDNTFWGLNRIFLDASVPPGSNNAFNRTVTAPASPGTYNFQWRMVQDGVEWFGGITPNCIVDVGTPASPPPGWISPWIQTTGGDVHSNTRINTPGGP